MYSRQNNQAGLPVVALVAILVVVTLVTVVVAWPYMSRADDYANPPDVPPDGAEDGTENPPDWMGKFTIKVDADPMTTWQGDVTVGSIAIKKISLSLEDYEGEPWSAGSMFDAAWLQPGADSYKVTYELTLTKGRTVLEDSGNFKIYKSEYYEGSGKSSWFFFWEELEGNWAYELTVKCEGKTDYQTGTVGILDGGAVVN